MANNMLLTDEEVKTLRSIIFKVEQALTKIVGVIGDTTPDDVNNKINDIIKQISDKVDTIVKAITDRLDNLAKLIDPLHVKASIGE